MNRYSVLSALALIALVILVPVYAAWEPGLRESARAQFRRQMLDEASTLYVQNCATCHGPAGEGSGAVPQLSNPALRAAASDHLFDAIARATHGTTMSAWHLSSGGTLTDYQITALVTLIKHPVWERVEGLSREAGVVAAELTAKRASGNPLVVAQWLNPSSPWTQGTKAGSTGGDPHQCAACHEEPVIHAERFGLDCARCHTLEAWQPALLTQHTFELDHGDQGQISCQTCHQSNYLEHTCYGCHDHRPEQMADAHLAEGIEEYGSCYSCHPTGREGEAQLIMALNAAQRVDVGDKGTTPESVTPIGAGAPTGNSSRAEGPAYYQDEDGKPPAPEFEEHMGK